jgi:transposase-like protein
VSDDTPIPFPARQDVQEDLREVFRGAIRFSLEAFLEEQLVEMIGADRYQRAVHRRDTRNGSYLRRLLTSLGHVDVAVPRSRESGSPGAESLGRYRRRTEDLDAAICEAYVGGVSTRGMQKVTKALTGESVKRSTVSRITKRLEEQVEQLRSAPIHEPITYLYLDATFLDARWARRVENVSALVAYGIGLDGKRQLLAVTIGAQESEESWADLLQQLLERGLSGVRLVIADGHAGLWKAVRGLLPEAQHQRCTVHLLRNVQAKAPQRLRARVAREVVGVLHAPSLAEAKRRRRAFEQGLGREVPEAATCLEDSFSNATAYYAFPKKHWQRIRSTNGLERLHGEVKRRIRAVGAFPDRASALRLITAVALQVTAIWSDRRYLDMTELAADKENDQAA